MGKATRAVAQFGKRVPENSRGVVDGGRGEESHRRRVRMNAHDVDQDR